jgi:ClpP class serine protease
VSTSLALSPLDIFWIFLLVSGYLPVLQRRFLEMQRWRALNKLQRERRSLVITLIHRQETISFLGIPLARYIDINDSEDILRAIHLTADDVPIDLVIHTPGGLVLAASQIAHALSRHAAPVRVLVPHYAMSGGTLIALSADEIVMDPNAVLGPVDPQLGEYPAASVLSVLDAKPRANIEDKTFILADVSRKAIVQVGAAVRDILQRNGVAPEKAQELADLLSTGTWTHDYPIDCAQAKAMGLPVSDAMPKEVYALMALYRQPTQRRPAVEYVPAPADRGRRMSEDRRP